MTFGLAAFAELSFGQLSQFDAAAEAVTEDRGGGSLSQKKKRRRAPRRWADEHKPFYFREPQDPETPEVVSSTDKVSIRPSRRQQLKGSVTPAALKAGIEEFSELISPAPTPAQEAEEALAERRKEISEERQTRAREQKELEAKQQAEREVAEAEQLAAEQAVLEQQQMEDDDLAVLLLLAA